MNEVGKVPPRPSIVARAEHVVRELIRERLPPEPQLSSAVETMIGRLLAPVHNAPADKPREKWTDQDRECALVLVPPDPSVLTSGEREAAAAAAQTYEEMLRPASQAVIVEWLLPFGLAVRNAQSRQETLARAAAIAAVLPNIPGACFVAETRQLLRTDYFPSAEDIRRALAPIAAQWRARADALRSLASAGASATPRAAASSTVDDWTPAEIERRIAGMEAGPRDHWARRRAALMERIMEAQAPDLLPSVRARLASLQALGPADLTHGVAGGEPKLPQRPAYLPPATLAAVRAQNPLVQRALKQRAELDARRGATDRGEGGSS